MNYWKPQSELEKIATKKGAKVHRFNSCLYRVTVGQNVYFSLDYFENNSTKTMALSSYLKYFYPAMKRWGLWNFDCDKDTRDILTAYFKRGGLCTCLETGKIYKGKIQIVDVNALYAYIISGLMPYGERLYHPPRGTYISFILVRIIHAKAKTNIKMFPNIDNLVNTGTQTNRLDEVRDQDIGMTQDEFNELKRWYTIKYKVLHVWYYRTGYIFTRVSEAFEKERLNGNKMAKALRNSAMGCFGMNNGGLAYLPVYVALTSLARTYLMKLIYKVRDYWIYSDTDSLVIKDCDLSLLGKGFINEYMGGGKVEATGNEFGLLQPKNYILYDKGKPVKWALSICKHDESRKTMLKKTPKEFIITKQFNANESWRVTRMDNQSIYVKKLNNKRDLEIKAYGGNLTLTTKGTVK